MANFKNPSKPELPDVLSLLKRDIFVSMNCVQVGVITSFDDETQTATITLALKQLITINPDGTQVFNQYPLLEKVPVMTLQGGGSFLSMPIAAGDNCIVLFNDRELDSWYVNGPNNPPVTPRAHDLSDGLAIVGLNPLTKLIVDFLANGVRLQFNSSSRIDLIVNAINSLATLWTHTGDMKVTGDFFVEGTTFGNEGTGTWQVNANIHQDATHSIHAGNGASGSFTSADGKTITVVDGIIVEIT